MSITTVEEFQKNTAAFLAAAERGEHLIIARGQKPVARLVPIEETGLAEAEHEDWGLAARRNLSRAYGLNEPDYTVKMIVEPNPDFRP
jgi:antitoxin (DNA-binding transcriptional repressor) of toxin-antitoxin stability system